MKQKRDLIIIGSDWLSCTKNSRTLFLRLAQNRKVLWVTTQGHAETAPAPIYHLNIQPPVWGDATWLQGLRQLWIAKQIRNTQQYLQLHAPVLLFLDPRAARLADHLHIDTIVYYRDELSLSHQSGSLDPSQETRLIAQASLLIAPNAQQAAAFPAYKTILLNQSTPAPYSPRPRDLPNGRPVIGFHGPLSDQLNWELLEYSARRRPDWYWVLIGPRQSDQLDQLLQHRNVFWLGEKSVEQLPAYQQHWQVTLLPYRNTPDICQCPPLPLEWALRSDQPVIVTADFEGLPRFKPLLSRIHTQQTLCELLPIVGNPLVPNPMPTPPTRHFQAVREEHDQAAGLEEFNADELGQLLDGIQ
jgi:hypothetical protein